MALLGSIPAHAQTTDAKFAAWLRGIRAEAARAGVDQVTLDATLEGIEEIPRVLELARNQPEFKMSFDRYLEIVVSSERISRGRTLLGENRAAIDLFAVPAGVPASVVVALWGIESNYGTRLGDFEVVPALATLAYNGFRAQFFRSQLIAALKILSQGHIGLHAMKGSWAGAMGQCQFIPTSFIAYAADGDGDGRMDIWTNKADVFASIVNYLRRVGWRPGLGWGEEVPAGTPPEPGGAYRPPGRSRGADLSGDAELPGHSAMEPVGFFCSGGRPPVRSNRGLNVEGEAALPTAQDDV